MSSHGCRDVERARCDAGLPHAILRSRRTAARRRRSAMPLRAARVDMRLCRARAYALPREMRKDVVSVTPLTPLISYVDVDIAFYDY